MMIFSNTLQNNQLNQIQTTIGTTGQLRLYTGSPPNTPEDAATGTLLCTINLPSGWFPAAVSGVKSKGGVWVGEIVTTGTPGYFRLLNSTGTVAHLQGTVGQAMSGADMIIDEAELTEGQAVYIDTFSITHGNKYEA